MVCLRLNHCPFWHFLDVKFSLFYALFYTKCKIMLVCFLRNNHHFRSKNCWTPLHSSCVHISSISRSQACIIFIKTIMWDTAFYIYTSYATLSSDILWSTLAFSPAYTKRLQLTSGIFHGIPQESIATVYFIPCQHNQWELRAANEGNVGCNTVEYTAAYTVWLIITKGIRIELGAHFDNGRRSAGQPRWHNDKLRFLVSLNKSIIIISLWSLPAVTKRFPFERLNHGFSKSFKTRRFLIPTAAIFIFNHFQSCLCQNRRKESGSDLKDDYLM